jgi:hypothetical protein
MPRFPIVIMAAGVLAGCQYGDVSPTAARAVITQDYASLGDRELCASFEAIRRCARAPLCSVPRYEGERVRAEIDRRKLIPLTDWAAVEAGSVTRGMGYCAVLAAWGSPIMASDAGQTTTMVFDGARSVGFMNRSAIVVTAPVSR